ncbi:MAG: hypothetical protein V4631_11750 [Pseudomonadota bacterium]
MNNAHIESKAVTSDQSGVHALVRRFAACCLIGVAAMSLAHAGPRDQGQSQQRDFGRAERMQRQDPRVDERQQRQYDPRDQREQRDQRSYESQARAEDQRRSQQFQQEQQNNADASRRSGRLTPDERRDLRRQINEAGAELYPARSRR